MANKGLTNITVTKSWRDGRAYFERYVDALRNAIGNVSSITNLNLVQIAKDISPNYSFTNNGTASLSKSLQDQINDIQAGGVPITGTTSNDFTIRSASNYLKLNAATLTTPVVLTSPNESGEIVLKDATQTLTNKTLTSPILTDPYFTNPLKSLQVGAYGLGIKYSAGTFTICKDDGTDLSSSNKGWIVMPSTTAGQLVTLEVTSNATFNDDAHASSDIVGEEFGTTAGVAYAEDRPFYIYAVNKDNTSSNLLFSISQIPHYKTSPASTYLGYKSNPAATPSDFVMFFLNSTSVATWASLPCLSIGSFRMRKSASDDWTVQTLSSKDGVGNFNEETIFNFPTGHNGAVAGKYFEDNGGTAPVFNQNIYQFSIKKNGIILINCYLNGDGGTDGSGAVTLFLSLPGNVENASGTTFDNCGYPVYIRNSGGTDGFCIMQMGNKKCFFYQVPGGITLLTNSLFSAGSRIISFTLTAQLATV